MLAYRLAHLKPEWETGQQISIDVGSNGIGKSSRALWGQIAKKLHVSPSTGSIQLAKRIIEWWQTQDVVFIFHTIDVSSQ
jgi:ABC-type cobalamin transport system ATPase subunit